VIRTGLPRKIVCKTAKAAKGARGDKLKTLKRQNITIHSNQKPYAVGRNLTAQHLSGFAISGK